MRKFLVNILIFLIPIILFVGIGELLLWNMPNDYKNKKRFLNEHANEIEVLFLGSSHTFSAINPDYISLKSYNAAYVSQSLDIDFLLLKKYASEFKQLEYVVLPISYFTLVERLETTPEEWRMNDYVRYFDLDIPVGLNYFEMKGNKLWYNLYRIMNYYVLGKSPLLAEENGWRKRPANSMSDKEMDESGKERAKLHTIDDPECFAENVRLLREMIEYCGNRNIHVILVTFPAYYTYTERMNEKQAEATFSIAQGMAEQYDFVDYLDYLHDSSFTKEDFFDADHLNESGAKKLSLKLNVFIEDRQNDRNQIGMVFASEKMSNKFYRFSQ